MTVNVISESVFLPKQAGGVHTAFLTHLQVLKKMRVEILVNSFKKADITHVHTFGPFALFKMLTSKNVVVSSHHLPKIFIGSYKGAKLFKGVITWFFKFYYNKADLVLALNNKTKEDLLAFGVKAKIEILPNAINTEIFKPNNLLRERMRMKYHISKNEIVILGAGYIIPRKGVEEFIALIDEFPNLRFIWVGGEPLKIIASEVNSEKKALREAQNRLIVTGIIQPKEMPSFYTMADIFLFPSFQETQGLVILEAAATGLPLILRDLEEYKYLYKHSYIPCKTHKQFDEAIKHITTDTKAYQKLRKLSLSLAKKFSLESVGNELLVYYRSLV